MKSSFRRIVVGVFLLFVFTGCQSKEQNTNLETSKPVSQCCYNQASVTTEFSAKGAPWQPTYVKTDQVCSPYECQATCK